MKPTPKLEIEDRQSSRSRGADSALAARLAWRHWRDRGSPEALCHHLSADLLWAAL